MATPPTSGNQSEKPSVPSECNYGVQRWQSGSQAAPGTKQYIEDAASESCNSKRKRSSPVCDYLTREVNMRYSVDSGVTDQEISQRALKSMFVLHGYHPSVADNPGIRAFVGALKPSFEMVTRKTFRNDIFDHYKMEKRKVLDYLQKNSSRVAVTTELWTDDKQKRDYIAFIGHFIDKSWKPRRCILRFLYAPYPYISHVLCEELYKCLQSWQLDCKLSTLTLHGSSTDDALLPQIKAKIGPANVLLGGRLLNIQCCAHSLDSVVKDGLEVITTAIEKIHDSVAYFHATPERYGKFKEAALSQQVELTEELCLDSKSKWNSTYTMLRIALGYNKVFDHLKRIDKNFTSCPTAEDWKSASSVFDRLKVFHELSEMFSGTKFVTANEFFIHVCDIKINMHEWLECGDPLIEKMSAAMVEKFDKYWFDIHGLMALAIILDPRGKMVMLEICYDALFGKGNSEQHVRKSRDFLCELINVYRVQREESIAALSVDKVPSLMEALVALLKARDAARLRLDNELDRYLEEGNIPYTGEEFDILDWWKFEGGYPILKMIARDIFAIPIARIVSESALCTGGRVLSGHCSRLSPKMLEALICCQEWHQNELQG